MYVAQKCSKAQEWENTFGALLERLCSMSCWTSGASVLRAVFNFKLNMLAQLVKQKVKCVCYTDGINLTELLQLRKMSEWNVTALQKVMHAFIHSFIHSWGWCQHMVWYTQADICRGKSAQSVRTVAVMLMLRLLFTAGTCYNSRCRILISPSPLLPRASFVIFLCGRLE